MLTLILERQQRPYDVYSFLGEEKPESWHYSAWSISHHRSDYISCVFFFFSHSLRISHTDFLAASPAQLCTRGPASHGALSHVHPANSLLGSKSWLMSHLLNDSLPNHSNPTLLVLLTPLFLSFPYLWSSNILYNVLITTNYLLSVSPTECKHHKASELCLE